MIRPPIQTLWTDFATLRYTAQVPNYYVTRLASPSCDRWCRRAVICLAQLSPVAEGGRGIPGHGANAEGDYDGIRCDDIVERAADGSNGSDGGGSDDSHGGQGLDDGGGKRGAEAASGGRYGGRLSEWVAKSTAPPQVQRSNRTRADLEAAKVGVVGVGLSLLVSMPACKPADCTRSIPRYLTPALLN